MNFHQPIFHNIISNHLVWVAEALKTVAFLKHFLSIEVRQLIIQILYNIRRSNRVALSTKRNEHLSSHMGKTYAKDF